MLENYDNFGNTTIGLRPESNVASFSAVSDNLQPPQGLATTPVSDPTSPKDVIASGIKLQYQGKTSFTDTTNGYILGIDATDGKPKFNFGNATNYFKFDGSTANISSVDIPNTTNANSFHVNTAGDTWWGATTFANAVASISKAGVAIFNSVTVTGDVNLPLINGVQGTEPTGFRNNTGAQGTFTSKVGLMTLVLSGTAAAGEVGIDTNVAFVDLSKTITFVIDFKFNQHTFSGTAANSAMQYVFMVGAQTGTTLKNCFGILATKSGNGSQTLGFSVRNYDSSGVATATTITPTVNATNKLIAVYTPSSQVQFTLNGTVVATHTTNLPTTSAADSETLTLDGQVQNSDVTSPPTVTISRYAVVGTGLS